MASPGRTQRLSQKQLRALSRALKRRGLKLPRVGYCALTTKIAGKYSNLVASSERRTSEICHHVIGGKHVYTVHVKNPPSWTLKRRGQRR